MNLCDRCKHGSMAECPADSVAFASDTDAVIGCDQFLRNDNPAEMIAELMKEENPNFLLIAALQTQVWYVVPKDRVVESNTGVLFIADRNTHRVGCMQYNRKKGRFLRLGPDVGFWMPVDFPQPPVGWRPPEDRKENKHGGWNDSEF